MPGLTFQAAEPHLPRQPEAPRVSHASPRQDGGGLGDRGQEGKKCTGTLNQPRAWRTQRVLLLWLCGKWAKYFISGLCFHVRNGPYSLSIKLLVHPRVVGLNNISLNNCESLLVLFLLEKKMKRGKYHTLDKGIKLIKIVNANNDI